jgi:hypothetical protein
MTQPLLHFLFKDIPAGGFRACNLRTAGGCA